MYRKYPLVQQTKKLWGLLINPRRQAPNTDEYRHYAILNTVILSLILIEVILLVCVPTFIRDFRHPPVYRVLFVALIFSVAIFVLAWRGHYYAAGTAIVVLVTGAVCAITLDLQDAIPLKFLAVSSVIGVIIFSRIGAWRIMIFNLVAAVATAYALPDGSISDIADDLILILILSMALLITVATTDEYLNTIRSQHSELIDVQKRELSWVAETERARVMREWVTYMSHDFRTPLAIMSTTLYVMERNHKPELNAQRIATLNQQIERLSRIVNSMHAAVSLNEEVVPHLEMQAVSPLLDEVVGRLAPVAAEHKVNIQLSTDESLPHILVDADAFRLAVECLLENAVLYNKAGGAVDIQVALNTQNLIVTVRDTGVGIAPKDLPFIFDRFYRVDKARQMEQGRNGLGLSIAKMVVEAHHGRIEVTSTVGQGSTFTILLPLPAAETVPN